MLYNLWISDCFLQTETVKELTTRPSWVKPTSFQQNLALIGHFFFSITNSRATTTQDKVWWYLFKLLTKSFSPHSFSWLILRITCKFILQGQKKTQHCTVRLFMPLKCSLITKKPIVLNTWIICRVYLEDHTQQKGFTVPFNTKQAQCRLDRPNLPFLGGFFPSALPCTSLHLQR